MTSQKEAISPTYTRFLSDIGSQSPKVALSLRDTFKETSFSKKVDIMRETDYAENIKCKEFSEASPTNKSTINNKIAVRKLVIDGTITDESPLSPEFLGAKQNLKDGQIADGISSWNGTLPNKKSLEQKKIKQKLGIKKIKESNE